MHRLLGGRHLRPINVSLDSVTWEYAKAKPNFSQWVRDKLRQERNETETGTKYCRFCGKQIPVKNYYDHKCEGIE